MCDAKKMLEAAMNDPSAPEELTVDLQAVYAKHFADDSGDNSPPPPHP